MADKVGGVYIEIQAKMGTLEADLKRLQGQLEKTDGKASQTSNTFSTMGKYLSGGVIAAGIYQIGKAAITAAAQMEQNRVAFTTMLGSASKANQLLKDMTAFAASTPFELPEIVNAGKQMLAFGFSSGEVIKNLRMLGDVSAGLSVPVGDMVYLFGQIKTQGRAMTQDLMQFANRGVPIFDELAKVLGVTNGQVKKFAEDGKIGFKDIEQVFKNLTKEGSKFGGLMDAQSKTLGGQWSNFNDSLGQTAVLMGNRIMPAAKGVLSVVSSMVDKYKEYLELTGNAADNQEKYISLTDMAAAGLTDVNEKLTAIYNQGGKNADYAALYAQYLQGGVKLSDAHVKQIEQMIGLSRSLSDINYVTNQNELESWKQRGFIVDKVAEKEAKAKRGGSGVNKEDERNKKAYESRLVYLELEAELMDKYGNLEYAAFSQRLDKMAEDYATFTSGLTGLSGQLSQLVTMDASNQAAAIDNKLKKQIDAIDEAYQKQVDDVNNSVMTEAEKTAALKALDEQKARDTEAANKKAEKEKRRVAREAAKIQKDLAIFETIIATPQAAFQAFKSAQVLPFPASSIVGATLAAAATALGVTKLKLIKDQPLPALAEGGVIPAYPGGRTVQVAEAGSSEAVIPLNDQTMNRLGQAIASAGGSGASTVNVTLNIDGDQFYNNIYNASKSGRLKIDNRAVV